MPRGIRHPRSRVPSVLDSRRRAAGDWPHGPGRGRHPNAGSAPARVRQLDAEGAGARATRGARGDRAAVDGARDVRARSAAASATIALPRVSRAERHLRRHLRRAVRLDRAGGGRVRPGGRVEPGPRHAEAHLPQAHRAARRPASAPTTAPRTPPSRMPRSSPTSSPPTSRRSSPSASTRPIRAARRSPSRRPSPRRRSRCPCRRRSPGCWAATPSSRP